MPVTIESIEREFVFARNGKDVVLPDPNPNLSADEVMHFYAGVHVELTTATLGEPEQQDGKVVYRFSKHIGTKG